MKFEDVENARQTYNDKAKDVRKKATAIVFSIIALLAALIMIPKTANIIQNVSHDFNFSPFVLAPVIFFVIMFIFFPIIIINVIVSLKTRQELKAYRRMYKAYFVSQQLAKIFTNLEYNREEGLNEWILSSTGMIYTGDRYSSNDLTKGKYKNVDFTQADVKIEEKHTDNEGNTTYVTVFKGRYMIFEFPKKFDFRMMVTPGMYYGFPGLKDGNKFKKIEVESTEFNKHFSINAEDGFEAFYLLDPAIISSIEELGHEYAYNLALYFVDNKLFIGINNGNDSFEPPNPKQPIDEKAETDKVVKDIKTITDFVDKLRLDRGTNAKSA